MRTACAFALVFVGAFLASQAAADVLYTQPPNPAGGQYKSAWYSPDGLDSDEHVWDAFTLASGGAINEVRWRGAYAYYNMGVGKAPVYDFTVSIYRSIAGGSQPDVGAGGRLVQHFVGGNAGETAVGTFGGVLMYDYAFVLPAPFQAVAGTKYWVQIEAYQGLTPNFGWPPDWSIARGTGGDGSHFRRVGGTRGQFYVHHGRLRVHASFLRRADLHDQRKRLTHELWHDHGRRLLPDQLHRSSECHAQRGLGVCELDREWDAGQHQPTLHIYRNC
ncbi:MAG: hypothetical protein HZA51_07380 [Planctomycetes bacterium]|nr:hypothetical protein [Planctomycetota bacterium]